MSLLGLLKVTIPALGPEPFEPVYLPWQPCSPPLSSLNDMSIYELHVRDFSVGDPTVPANRRGSYEAFSEWNSNGMLHLRTLAASGLKAVHLLPTFHFGSVNEDCNKWANPGPLSPKPPEASSRQPLKPLKPLRPLKPLKPCKTPTPTTGATTRCTT